MKRKKELKEGQIVLVPKGEKGDNDADRYIAIIRSIASFDYCNRIIVEFLGGKTESLKEEEVIPISPQEARDYLNKNLVFRLVKLTEKNKNISNVFLEISEIIKKITH